MRGLIKWILFAILLVIAIILIINFVKRTEKTQPVITEPSVDIVERQPEEDITDNLPQEESMEPNLTVDSPNTASSGLPHIIIGIVILAYGTRYIYTNSKLVKGNS